MLRDVFQIGVAQQRTQRDTRRQVVEIAKNHHVLLARGSQGTVQISDTFGLAPTRVVVIGLGSVSRGLEVVDEEGDANPVREFHRVFGAVAS